MSYTVRIKQRDTGCWRAVTYHDLITAAHVKARLLGRKWVIAIFDGNRKLVQVSR